MRNLRDLFDIRFVDLLFDTIGINVAQQSAFRFLRFTIADNGTAIIGMNGVAGTGTAGQGAQLSTTGKK